MAGRAIGQFGVEVIVAFGTLNMALQTPAHVHPVLRHSYGHLADLSVAGLAVQSGSDVWAVHELNKIRHNGNWYPWDLLA